MTFISGPWQPGFTLEERRQYVAFLLAAYPWMPLSEVQDRTGTSYGLVKRIWAEQTAAKLSDEHGAADRRRTA